MKKLVSLLLAAVMCLSLAACGGGPDKQPAIDAYNKAADAVNAVVDIMNANLDVYGDYVDSMNQIVSDLNEVADALENDKLEQSVLDELITQCQTIEELAVDLKSDMDG